MSFHLWLLYVQNNVRKNGHQINVIPVWDNKVTGKGVVVTVVDDGLEHTHPDVVNSYDPQASWDMNGNDPDPFPNEADPINSHGTRCCGQIVMAMNNGVCGVGVAYDARIGAVRMLDGDVTDAIEARSLGLQPQHIDIYTNSWGPNDDGRTMESPGPLAQQALMQGVSSGRGGKGSIFLFANGNGGSADDCNADGYANSLYTIAIGAIAEDGSSPWYTEQCSATVAVTFSSGSAGQRAISTIDLHSGCTSDHTGTSAASPMAAGMIALVLEVNSALGWRDVQYIIVRTAQITAPDDPGWAKNAAGLHINPKFGFGSMDASLMVDLARTWVPVGPHLVFRSSVQSVASSIPFATEGSGALEAKIVVSTTETDVRFLEHVQVTVNIDASRRGSVVLELISPSGTSSTLLSRRPYDDDNTGIHWTFMTVRCWGETALGAWTLRTRFAEPQIGRLEDWQLILYGLATSP